VKTAFIGRLSKIRIIRIAPFIAALLLIDAYRRFLWNRLFAQVHASSFLQDYPDGRHELRVRARP
jgi:hypothetical protein